MEGIEKEDDKEFEAQYPAQFGQKYNLQDFLITMPKRVITGMLPKFTRFPYSTFIMEKMTIRYYRGIL